MNIFVIVALVFIGIFVWVAVKNRWVTGGTPSSTAFSSGDSGGWSWGSSSSDSGSGDSGSEDCSSDGGGSDGGGGGDGGCD